MAGKCGDLRDQRLGDGLKTVSAESCQHGGVFPIGQVAELEGQIEAVAAVQAFQPTFGVEAGDLDFALRLP